MEITDQELLTRFSRKQSESSFRRLVDRHLKMVYSVAYRVTGERGLAEEIAQSTFAKLAETEQTPEVVAGWLYHTARNLALTVTRSESRRRKREETAVAMNVNEPSPDQLTEHLEPALEQLGSEERDVLVLRFFEERNLRDVGAELNLSEDAARMRVNRALEKLKSIFGKLGITGTTTWLATALPTSASAAVPSGLVGNITTTILSGGALAATATTLATETASNTMHAFLNLKTASAVVAAAAITGTSTYMAKDKEVEEVTAEFQALTEMHAQLAEQQSNALNTIQLRDRQITSLENDVADIHRLRGEVDRLNNSLIQMNRLKRENESMMQADSELRNELSKLKTETRDESELEDTPSRLFTRTYKLGDIDFRQALLEATGTDDDTLTEQQLFEICLRQAGIELNPPAMFYIDVERGALIARGELKTIERMNWLVRLLTGNRELETTRVAQPFAKP